MPKIRNWAVNDTLTSSLRRTVQDKEAFWKFLQPYLHSRQEQEQRFALISFKNCFLDETHLPRIFKLLQTLDCRGYYARMKKHSFRRNTLIGFLFALAGIFLMLDSSAGSSLPAVLMSLAAGVSIVTARSMV